MRTPTKANAAGAILSAPVRIDGGVIIRPWKPGRVQLDFVTHDGTRQQPVIPATDMAAAETAARQVGFALQAKRLGVAAECPLDIVARLQGRPRPVNPAEVGPSITDALSKAIETGSRARPEWKKELRDLADLFIDWLEASKPDMPNQWGAVSHSVVQEYVSTLSGLSQDRMTHRLAPIRLTARFWASQEPNRFRDVTAGVRLPEGRPRRGPVALSADQIQPFLSAVESLAPALYPVAALTILAGLRVYEAAHLRLCDVDLKAATVTVTDTGTHVPKNGGSWRTVPLAPAAVDLLREIIGRTQPVDSSAPLFLSPSGLPWCKKRLDDAWKRFKKAVEKANKTADAEGREKIILPDGYTLRGGRRTFVTAARKAGADRTLIKRYIGHAAGDILGGHYDAVDAADMATVGAAFQTSFVNAPLTGGKVSSEIQQG